MRTKTLISEAKTEGELAGEKRGEKRGEQIGQRKNNLSVAKKMLENRLNIEMISKITGLSKKELEAIQNEKENLENFK